MSEARPRERSVSEEVRGNAQAETRSYYGQPIIKEPTWEWQIPAYFFTGGLAGASSGLGLLADLVGNRRLARSARLAAIAGATASPVFLILDLGVPKRFYNMLRVFKPTSPMSVGTWILSVFGTSSGIVAATDVLGIFPRLGKAAETVAALLGPALATYTAVLIADTSVPVWHEARRELPLLFAASSAASAGAAAVIFVPTEDAGPARRLLIGGSALEIAVSETMKRHLGGLAEPYEQEEAGRYEKLSTALTVSGAAFAAIFGRRRRWAAVLGGALGLGGALAKRWAIFKAGFQSARDPKYVVRSQRERLEGRPPDQRRTDTFGRDGSAV
ncbi:MAG: polysulfide reductase NrfD [Actinomycetota bacterium]|nr:polysulfide reductase NrfD [Actinomycetota bacterium]